MKKVAKRFLCMIVVIMLLCPVFSADATTKKATMRGGIDYSGNGTVIEGNIASGSYAKVSGNYVKIPIYKGKYEAKTFDYWWTKSWSKWSTTNNKKNADFSVYNGTDKATEYNVESRKEYQYKRVEKQDVYSTKYYTQYKGTKFYNSFITKTESSWNGYPGSKNGYKIIKRYTKTEKSGTKNVTVYDKTWRTSAPFRWSWENKWEVYNTRTTYRYRARTLIWNDKAQISSENVPLKYSLYKTNGTPIEAGIRWTYGSLERKYVQQKERNILQTALDNGVTNEMNLNINMYYITSKEVMKKIRDDLIKYCASQWGNGGENAFIDFIEGKIVDALRDTGMRSFANKVASKGLGVITVAMLEYIDLSVFYADQAAFVEYLATINDKIASSKSTLILSFVHNYSAKVMPSRKVRLGNENVTSVSMLYDYNFCSQQGLEYYIPDGAKAYGTVSYLSDDAMWDEINYLLNNDFYSWETVLPWDIVR